MKSARVILKTKKDQSVRRFHPWVFSGAIKKIKNEQGKEIQPKEGDIVEVYSNKDEFLATGHYQKGSIAIRLFSFEQESPDSEFWKSRLKSAWEKRLSLGFLNDTHTNAFRLVNAEGDGLPGLIMDYYNGIVVIQTHSIGMHLIKKDITKALQDIVGEHLKGVYDKSEETMPGREGMTVKNQYLLSSELTDKEIIENGCRFKVDWETGQKTGFFLDQRENRKLLSNYSRGKLVLNCFCYTGGFSIYALLAAASKVHSVDSSKSAIQLTEDNIRLNDINPELHQSFKADVMEYMKDINNRYDLIVLDPPAFAKRRSARHQAVQGYKRLNALALKQIKPGGIVFTFSCSQVVDRSLFYNTVMAAAISAGRQVSVLHQLSQPADHPINIFHPEGQYLKGLVLRVQ